jgi:hypothetical protein
MTDNNIKVKNGFMWLCMFSFPEARFFLFLAR